MLHPGRAAAVPCGDTVVLPQCHLAATSPVGHVSLLELMGGLLGCTDTQGTEEHPGGITHPVSGSVCRARQLPQSYKEMPEPGPCRLSITHQEHMVGRDQDGPGPGMLGRSQG